MFNISLFASGVSNGAWNSWKSSDGVGPEYQDEGVEEEDDIGM